MRNALRGKHIRVFPQVDWSRQLNGAADSALTLPATTPPSRLYRGKQGI
jgi:hypothetical protein